MESIINGIFVGGLYFFGEFVYNFLSLDLSMNLSSTFVVEFIFIVVIAFFSYWKIKSTKFGVLFGLVVPLATEIISAIFYGALPFGYLGLFADAEYAGLLFAILAIRYVGFPIAGFYGSYVWIGKEQSKTRFQRTQTLGQFLMTIKEQFWNVYGNLGKK
jgi:hypothetical protein